MKCRHSTVPLTVKDPGPTYQLDKKDDDGINNEDVDHPVKRTEGEEDIIVPVSILKRMQVEQHFAIPAFMRGTCLEQDEQ